MIDVKLRIDYWHPVLWILVGLVLSISLSIHIVYTPDSMHYVDIARNLSSGEGLTTYYLNIDSASVPDRVLPWPPLYPFLLAAWMKAGLSADWAVRLILVLSFVLSSIMIYILARTLSGRQVAVLSIVVWLCIAPFIRIWTFAWSEAVFITLSGAFLMVLAASARASFSLAKLVVAGALAGLAAICRYVGIACILTALVSLAYLLYAVKPRRRKAQSLTWLFGILLGYIPVCLPWLFYNLSITGSLTGVSRPPAVYGLLENAARVLTILARDLMLPVGILVTLAVLSPVNRGSLRSVFGRISSTNTRAAVTICCAWSVVYGLVIIVAASICRFYRIDTRLVCPIYVGLIPLLIHIGYSIYTSTQGRKVVLSRRALGVVLVILIASAFGSAGIDVFRILRDRNRTSMTLTWINETTPPSSLFIGGDISWVRFETGRPVLESGWKSDSELTPESVSRFLEKFGEHFSRTYLMYRELRADDLKTIERYRETGYSLTRLDVGETHVVYEIVQK